MDTFLSFLPLLRDEEASFLVPSSFTAFIASRTTDSATVTWVGLGSGLGLELGEG